MIDYVSSEEPVSNVSEYFRIDEETVGVVIAGENRWRQKTIYHESDNGILCDDFKTYIDFEDAKEVVEENENC